MRAILKFNDNWAFSKEPLSAENLAQGTPLAANAEPVTLPHCWNAIDGQDGGNDYHRGTCYYSKAFGRQDLPVGTKHYLEVQGANSSADVYLNGKHLGHHDGGYSTWRLDMTDALADANTLIVAVDNSENDRVYPQMADFTFYGGLYRDVNVIGVEDSHFDLDYYGGPGLKVTPAVNGEDALVKIETWVTGHADYQTLRYQILDQDRQIVAEATSADTNISLDLPKVHLWHGRKDPYLYTAQVELLAGDQVLDQISARFGCRTFEIDPDRGFILNGKEYPLRGVSRHQDRWQLGNALLPEHHEEDMALICEMGATTIRLAHYQHDQYFYDLCDEAGMVVWAEIPYISRHMATGRENTISQMTELIVQNYNHPSIVVWGLSNEITMNGPDDPDLLENHRILNDLAHKMDPTRLTTMACLTMCSMDAEYVHIPDVVSYNHYFGWYGGETSMNGPWFDRFHAKYPKTPIGCSEYGCEALNWHTSEPAQGDYTEEYQAYYHEELIKQFYTRKYLWATHVWNMFDFGADARCEGGENGQNHKGLVTIDRKYKKDSFYAYKAWLSDEPFVHICGKRYVDRVEAVTRVTIYSNQPRVELFANGVSLGAQECPDHFFYFNVPNEGETALLAVAGECQDESRIRKVDTFNENYRLVEKNAILNWFDINVREGYFSLNDKVGDIMKTFRGKLVIMGMAKKLLKSAGGTGKSGKSKSPVSGMKLSKDLLQMLGSFTILRLTGLMGTAGLTVTKEDLLELNAKLNKIRKSR